jgi:hypothetical protein
MHMSVVLAFAPHNFILDMIATSPVPVIWQSETREGWISSGCTLARSFHGSVTCWPTCTGISGPGTHYHKDLSTISAPSGLLRTGRSKDKMNLGYTQSTALLSALPTLS